MSKARKNTFRCQHDVIGKLAKTIDQSLKQVKFKFNILELQMACYVIVRNLDMHMTAHRLRVKEKK